MDEEEGDGQGLGGMDRYTMKSCHADNNLWNADHGVGGSSSTGRNPGYVQRKLFAEEPL